MTAPCSGGGVGVAKPGFASLQFISPAAIGGALAGLSGWGGALVGASIGGVSYDLSTFCPGGPPAAPTFTIADIAGLLSPWNPVAYTPAAAKFQDFLGVVFWPILCQCSGGASVVPAPSTYPAGGPQSPVVAPVTPPAFQSFYPMLASQTKAYGLGGGSPVPPTSWYLPGFDDSSWSYANGVSGIVGGSHWSVVGGYQNGAAVAANAALVGDAQVLSPTHPIAHNFEQFLLRWRVYLGDINTTLATWRPASFFQAGGGWSTGLCYVNGQGGNSVPNNAISWQALAGHLVPNAWNTVALWINSGNNGSANTWGTDGGVDLGLDFTSAQQSVNAAPCCPPDPIAQSYLDQILTLVQLIQRQSVPFAYVASTAHAGLTGAGSLAIQGLIGVRVTITIDPVTLGVEGTSPAKLFDRGFLTFATADGALSTTRLEHTNQLILPCDAGVFTLLYYDLTPGVTVTITELLREP